MASLLPLSEDEICEKLREVIQSIVDHDPRIVSISIKILAKKGTGACVDLEIGRTKEH